MRTPTNIVLLAGPDLVQSGVGSRIKDRVLAALPESALEIVVAAGNASTILAQRLDAGSPRPASGPPQVLDGWFQSMFESPARFGTAALVHSLHYDLVGSAVFRNRAEGYLVQPPDDYASHWDSDAIEWLDRDFELLEQPDAESVGVMLKRVATTLPEHIHLVVLNTSTVFRGGNKPSPNGETMRMLANRLALALDRAAVDSDLVTVDVDRLVAELGADEHVIELGRYSESASENIAEEASELILDLPEVAVLIKSDGMQLLMPRYDRRTSVGIIERWHLSPGSVVADGDPMFDLRFEDLHSRLTEGHGRKTGRHLRLTAIAASDGFLHEIIVPEGESVPVGDLVGIMSREGSSHPGDVSNSRRFRVGMRRDDADRATREDV
ncbi:MAG TPA: hypothetical protein VIW94_10760 [Acidimicrobiia bacterium]